MPRAIASPTGNTRPEVTVQAYKNQVTISGRNLQTIRQTLDDMTGSDAGAGTPGPLGPGKANTGAGRAAIMGKQKRKYAAAQKGPQKAKAMSAVAGR